MEKRNLNKRNIKLTVADDIFLKVLTSNDVDENYVYWLNDYSITKFTEQKYFKHTFDSIKEFVTQKYESENDLLFGIFVKGKHIGNIKLGPINFYHLSAEVSFLIGEKKLWGKGIASVCTSTIVQYAVAQLGLKKITAGYYENNTGSAKVFQKCGFIIEGKKRSQLIFEDQRIDHISVGYHQK